MRTRPDAHNELKHTTTRKTATHERTPDKPHVLSLKPYDAEMCATHFGHGLQPWSVMPSAMPGPIVLSNYNTSFAFRGLRTARSGRRPRL